MRPWCQRSRGDRHFVTCRDEVHRAEEERRRRWRPKQDLVQDRNDPSATELGHFRECVGLAAAILDSQRAPGRHIHRGRREVPSAGELVLLQLLNEDVERRTALTIADGWIVESDVEGWTTCVA